MTKGGKIIVGICTGFFLCVFLCCGGYGVLFHFILNSDTFKKQMEAANARAQAEEARPHPSKAHYDQITTGMSENEVEKLLGMAARIEEKDGAITKVWEPESNSDAGIIRVTFRDGKTILKSIEPTALPITGNAAKALSPEAGFWKKHSGHWNMEVTESWGRMLFRFDAKDGEVSNFESGVRVDGTESSGSEDPIGTVQIEVQEVDSAKVRFQLMAKQHVLTMRFNGARISGTTADGHAISGTVE